MKDLAAQRERRRLLDLQREEQWLQRMERATTQVREEERRKVVEHEALRRESEREWRESLRRLEEKFSALTQSLDRCQQQRRQERAKRRAEGDRLRSAIHNDSQRSPSPPAKRRFPTALTQGSPPFASAAAGGRRRNSSPTVSSSTISPHSMTETDRAAHGCDEAISTPLMGDDGGGVQEVRPEDVGVVDEADEHTAGGAEDVKYRRDRLKQLKRIYGCGQEDEGEETQDQEEL